MGGELLLGSYGVMGWKDKSSRGKEAVVEGGGLVEGIEARDCFCC